MEELILYADIEVDSDDWFVVTPEGNYFNFPANSVELNVELNKDKSIVDPTSHKIYVVRFYDE